MQLEKVVKLIAMNRNEGHNLLSNRKVICATQMFGSGKTRFGYEILRLCRDEPDRVRGYLEGCALEEDGQMFFNDPEHNFVYLLIDFSLVKKILKLDTVNDLKENTHHMHNLINRCMKLLSGDV